MDISFILAFCRPRGLEPSFDKLYIMDIAEPGHLNLRLNLLILI